MVKGCADIESPIETARGLKKIISNGSTVIQSVLFTGQTRGPTLALRAAESTDKPSVHRIDHFARNPGTRSRHSLTFAGVTQPLNSRVSTGRFSSIESRISSAIWMATIAVGSTGLIFPG